MNTIEETMQSVESTQSNLQDLFDAIKATGVTHEQYMGILEAIRVYNEKEAQS